MQITSEYLTSGSGLELLNKIFTSAGEGIVIVNKTGKIQLANERASEIFEYDRRELTGRTIEDLIPKEARKRHEEYRDQYFKKPVSRPMGIGRHLTGVKSDGRLFPVEVSLSYVLHNDEELVVAFVTDITKRKEQEDALRESEEKLKEYAAELESKVKERTRELEHLNLGLKSQIRERKLAEEALKNSLNELKKAEKDILKALETERELNELKSRFISMASHEFRTPLTTILSSADLISRYQETAQQENREKHIQRIKTSVQNLTNILNDFLSLEKLESGALELKTETFSIHNLLREIKEEFDPTLKKDQTLEIAVPEGFPVVHSDPHILKNIIINLTSNAIKYSGEGKPIKIEVSHEDDAAHIAVIDQGMGIPEEEQKNLFRRFYRANNVTAIQGTGLGLNIVKRYLSLIDGNITFTSQERKGSEFIVTFPLE